VVIRIVSKKILITHKAQPVNPGLGTPVLRDTVNPSPGAWPWPSGSQTPVKQAVPDPFRRYGRGLYVIIIKSVILLHFSNLRNWLSCRPQTAFPGSAQDSPASSRILDFRHIHCHEYDFPGESYQLKSQDHYPFTVRAYPGRPVAHTPFIFCKTFRADHKPAGATQAERLFLTAAVADKFTAFSATVA
jgi:hypothetical protein